MEKIDGIGFEKFCLFVELFVLIISALVILYHIIISPQIHTRPLFPFVNWTSSV